MSIMKDRNCGFVPPVGPFPVFAQTETGEIYIGAAYGYEDGTAEYGKYLKKLSDFLLTPGSQVVRYAHDQKILQG